MHFRVVLAASFLTSCAFAQTVDSPLPAHDGVHHPVYSHAGMVAAQDETAAMYFEILRQARERVVEPPAGGGAERPNLGRLVIKEIQGDHRPAIGRSGDESGVVSDAKIVAKPQQDGLRGM